MNNKKRILAFLAAACIMASGTAMAEYDPDKVIDTSIPYTTLSETDETLAIEEVPSEEAAEYDVLPICNFAMIDGIHAEEVNGITMIPLRSVAESLSYTVNWNGEARSVEIIRGAQYITITLDKDEYTFSRRAPEQLGAAPTLVGNSTYVPLSFVDRIIGGYYYANEDGTYKIVQPAVVTVTEIGEDGTVTVDDALLGAVILNISDETAIVKGMDRRIYKIDDLAVGMTLHVEYSDWMTASFPPQNTPVKVIIASELVQEEADEAISELSFSGVITEINGELVTIGDPINDADAKTLVISDETVITKGKDKRIYKINDLEVGMEISGTHAEAMTMSIPPQTAALTVQIAVGEEEIALEGIEISGIITAIEEELVTVSYGENQEIVLVVTDETAITKGKDRRIYKIDDLAVGMSITAVHSEAATMSIPPQSAAFSIAIANDAE